MAMRMRDRIPAEKEVSTPEVNSQSTGGNNASNISTESNDISNSSDADSAAHI